MARVTWVQSQVVLPKTQKMVLYATLLNTQHYKMRIKSKVEQSREWSRALPYISGQQLLKREPSGHSQQRSLTLLTIQYYTTTQNSVTVNIQIINSEFESYQVSNLFSLVPQLSKVQYIYIYIYHSVLSIYFGLFISIYLSD